MENIKKVIAYIVLIINLIAFYWMPLSLFIDLSKINYPSWIEQIILNPILKDILIVLSFSPLDGFIGFFVIFYLFSDLDLGRKFRVIAKYTTLGNMLLFPLVLITIGFFGLLLPVLYFVVAGFFIKILITSVKK